MLAVVMATALPQRRERARWQQRCEQVAVVDHDEAGGGQDHAQLREAVAAVVPQCAVVMGKQRLERGDRDQY
jgi:hypothetical protein